MATPQTNLVQAGTEQDARDLSLFGIATNYYAWTEVYPLQGITEAFSVSPDDAIEVRVWVGDGWGHLNPSGGYAWFAVSDATSGMAAVIAIQLPSNFDFTGNSAEWIMERPFQSALNGYPELADYNTCQITGATLVTATGTTWTSYSSASSLAARRRLAGRVKTDTPPLSGKTARRSSSQVAARRTQFSRRPPASASFSPKASFTMTYEPFRCVSLGLPVSNYPNSVTLGKA